jgi:hypothetical protein
VVQRHRVAGCRDFRRIEVARGMVGLVVRRELGSERDWDRSSVEADIVAVVGSLAGEGEDHSLVAGVGEGCSRNLVREGRASARERERSWVGEDKEIGFLEERSWVDLHGLVEGGNHRGVGYRRSNRYLTL